MIIHGIILLVIALIVLALGFYIYNRDPKNAVNISFLFTATGVTIWILANSFIAINTDTESALWYRMAYFAGVLIASSVLYFSWVFPYRLFQTGLWRKVIVLVPAVAFAPLFFLTDSIIIGVQRTSDLTILEYGKLFPLYVAFFALFFLWTLFSLIKKYRRSNGMHRWQLKYVIISILIPFVANMITDMIIPMAGSGRPAWMEFTGAELSVVWLGFTAYVAFKKKVV
ncbi:MAG: histidine kinase N-terminal 7TM domain-containing protein [Patescibacteria group bacterium]|nr:histidine kinase N-terminal 7TM domain-containing protein [Patescibacteria group bacterium]